MKIPIIHFWLFLLAAPVLTAPVLASEFDAPELQPKRHDFWLNKSYEDGVTDRALIGYLGRFALGPRFMVDAGLQLGVFDESASRMIGIALAYHIEWLRSEAVLATQHEDWPGWSASENRAEAYWRFNPFWFFNALFGVSYRAPLFGGTSFWESFHWPWQNAEINTIYRVEFQLIHTSEYGFSVAMWNYDHMRLYNWDHFHFGAQGSYRIDPKTALSLSASTALKGMSGVILSLSEFELGLGLSYAP